MIWLIQSSDAGFEIYISELSNAISLFISFDQNIKKNPLRKIVTFDRLF